MQNRQMFSADDVSSILRSADLVNNARLAGSIQNPPNDFQIVTLTLGYNTERNSGSPYVISFPFRSVYVVKSTHPSLVVKLKPYTQDHGQSSLEMSEKDVLDFGTQIPRAFIHWDAQTASGDSSVTQTVTLMFSVTAQFKAGSLSTVKGSIHTDVYQSFSQSIVTIATAAATQISSVQTTDASYLLQWNGSDVLYLGGSTVSDTAPNKGYAVQAGDSFRWNNKSAVYGYSANGGELVVIKEF